MGTDAQDRDLIVDMLEQDPWSPEVERRAADLAADSPAYREMESMADGLVIAVAPQWGNIATTFGKPVLARAAAEALRFLALQAAAQTDRLPEQLFAGLRGGRFSSAHDADDESAEEATE